MEWVAGLAVLVAFLIACFAGFNDGKSKWSSAVEGLKEREAQILEREVKSAEVFRGLQHYQATLDERQKFLESLNVPPCVPSHYEQLCTPCMN